MEIIAADDAWALARWRGLLVVVWRKTPTLDRARQVGAELVALTAEPGGPTIHILTVIEGRAGVPDVETRAVIKEALRGPRERIGSVAALVLLDGFVGAAVRASLAAMIVILRERHPIRVFGEPSETAAWLATRMGGVGEAEVAAAIEQVRSA